MEMFDVKQSERCADICLNMLTYGGRSVGIVRLQIKSTEFVVYVMN
jgi:hypothetical protein